MYQLEQLPSGAHLWCWASTRETGQLPEGGGARPLLGFYTATNQRGEVERGGATIQEKKLR